jgi:hypothetical protein
MSRIGRARGIAAIGSRLLRNNRISAGIKTAAVIGAAAGGAFIGSSLGTPKRADPYRGASTSFPIELEEIDHWIEFTAVETPAPGLNAINSLIDTNLAFGNQVIGGTIRLPMTSNLSTDYNPDYTSQDLGPALGMALKPIEQKMYEINSMASSAGAGVGQSGLAGIVARGVAGTLAGTLSNALSRIRGVGEQGVAAALKVGAGVSINPHKIVLFTGVNFREHQFSWKLSPKNREESNRIKGIIDQFIYYSHPQYVSGGLFFKYPEFFKIRFRHPEYLFELLPSVCKDVRVNYHGQGYPGYIRESDGLGPPAPAEIELSLTFMELEIVTKDSLYKDLNTAGTFRTTPGVQQPGGGPTGVGG